MFAWGAEKECEKSFRGEGNDLCLDCGSSFIGIYVWQNSEKMQCIMYLCLYCNVCVFVCFSYLLHSACQHILLAALSESIQSSVTSYFQCHPTSLAHHDLLFGELF